MDFNLKKSKMFLLSIIPFCCIIALTFTILNLTANTPVQTLFNSQSTSSLIGLLIGNIAGSAILCIYAYLGIIFYKKKELTFYKIFAILNFIFFGLSIFLNILAIFLPILSQSTQNSGNIFYVFLILFNILNIFFIFNYNHQSKKLSFT